MSSQRQKNANRRNAQRSTGPRTQPGKARVAQNARRHGLLAKEAVLPEEDPQQYLDLCAALHEEHQPATPLEEFCVEQMASAQWRLRRLVRVETGYFAERLYDTGGMRGVRLAIDPEVESLPKFDMDTRLLGTVLKEDARGDPIVKLTRYETVIRRSFYKALETLLEAQARRPDPPVQNIADETKPIPVSDTPAEAPPNVPAEPAEPEPAPDRPAVAAISSTPAPAPIPARPAPPRDCPVTACAALGHVLDGAIQISAAGHVS